ncbi:MAG: VOC family protein [Pseudomonadota bacterium]
MSTIPAVSPYLTVRNAQSLLAFYKAVFDATVLSTMPAEDGVRLMHATISVHGTHIMLCDEFPEHGGDPAPDPDQGSPVALSLRLETSLDVDALYQKALDHGGKMHWEPSDMFWGDRFAQFIDPSGHRWMLVARKDT